MFSEAQLKKSVHIAGLSRKEQVLLCLALDPVQPRSIADLRRLAVRIGLPAAKKWNLSAVVGSLTGMAIRVSGGWELTDSGKALAAELVGTAAPPPGGSTLRALLQRITSPEVSEFVEEAISSVEARRFRSAVVLSWAGAVAVLYDFVIANHLADFNAEALRRDTKWRAAKSADDMARMKEHDFLQVIEAISMIGKSVKTELEGCLKLRNGCGHPNSLKIAEHRVNSHIETLVLNVYTRFL